ncbi:peptidoglycan-binding domain-containing protein [Anabaena azotica]|uniref:Peptidoglycan-binding protein n=1 Tax=Anabaena azotica FACHB-119 TaxID=947527 RepID=A0ABR8D8V8_9NOST|nr:peptidoglycan-binding domain-containing protein [Anabaena azotica]MBD2502566.1 peptidoglycan-binding protein [Anabaena azotica FACHB-119]
MNWKVIALVPALTLATALPGYSLTKDKNHHPTTATHAAQVSQPSHTMKIANSLHKTNIKDESSTAGRDRAITIGSRGEAVRNAQSLLKQRGFYTASINGVFDQKTRAAVMKFQKSKGLRADGVLGSKTLAALR